MVAKFVVQVKEGDTDSHDFFDGAAYSDKVLRQMKQGDFHSFPESVKAFQDVGQVRKIKGGDGVVPTGVGDSRRLSSSGCLRIHQGPHGKINHRLFRPYSRTLVMENVWSGEIDSILRAGRSLESAGVGNWALEREAALKAIERLSAKGVAVLGGDVYTVSDQQRIESNYDNWYCDREPGETDADFLIRSIRQEKNYVLSYQAPATKVLFALVPSV